MFTPLRIFVGYDSKEPAAYAVLCHSILARASGPVSITPLVLSSLRTIYTRGRGPTEATEFSMTRFLVPYLSGYTGWSLFLDCDMLCQTDILALEAPIDVQPDAALLCCQHDYVPRGATKMQGQVQTSYPRKNWSSLMLFNNARCTALTPAYVNSASGLDLHRFNWLRPDDAIGSLPLEWNWLVGEYPPNPTAALLHYTLGGPWFPETRECDQADLWNAEYSRLRGALVEA